MHARKTTGLLRAGDGGQAPASGSGQGRWQNTHFHGFWGTVSGHFGCMHALRREKTATCRGALMRDF